MRVLHVLDVSAPTIAGYATRSRAIVNAQRRIGLDPVVLTSVRHHNPGTLAVEQIDGIHHYRTLLPRPPRRQALLEMHHLRRRILEVARSERPEAIHAHSPILVGIPAWLASRQLGLPCVYEIRSFWEDAVVERGATREGSLRYRTISVLETMLARRVGALVCICAGLGDDMIRRGLRPEDVHIVPNGVDTALFVPTPPDEAIRRRYGFAGKTVVGYIGTFFAFEGVRLLVKALVKLIKEEGRDDVRGLIVGTGTTYEDCRAIASAAGVEDKILHPGRIPHDEVIPLYSMVDVFAYPRASLRLTELVTPLKPLEAMAMEKAVIASDVGGLRELIEDGVTGLLHRHDDADDLAAKIVRLVDDGALRDRLARAARTWVLEQREWRSLVCRYGQVYERARARLPGRTAGTRRSHGGRG